MSSTNFMNLTLPIVTTTLGPEWATQLNEALIVVDDHDHTSGKGKQIPTEGININANLDFKTYKLFNLSSTQYLSQLTPLSGASAANSISASGGNLYFTNGAGVAVQITSGAAVVPTPSTFQSFQIVTQAADVTITPSDTFVLILLDTTAPRTITLPLASGVADGRVYIVKDISGQANLNPVTIQVSGADEIDGASSLVIDSNNFASFIVGDGFSKWYVI